MSAIPITPGHCSGCDTPIWLIDPITHRLKMPLPNYREFFFCTNNERMNRHAICAGCINTLTTQKVAAIFERIRETWRQQMVGSASVQDFIKLNNMQVACWDVEEKKCEDKYYGR